VRFFPGVTRRAGGSARLGHGVTPPPPSPYKLAVAPPEGALVVTGLDAVGSPSMRAWSFDVPPNAAVVTTTYVTRERLPILLVSHEADEDGGISWQFHCGNGDDSPSALQFVGLETILQLDPPAGGDLKSTSEKYFSIN
jgi:hypothetical protein